MSYGQGGPPSQWDPWKPNSQQPWTDGDDGVSPDWAALADASEQRSKRRRLFFIGGGVLATLGIGTAVAMAVVSAGSDDEANRPTSSLPAAELPSASGTPSFAPTTAPPPLDPKDFVSSKAKDKAPISPDLLFPGTQLTMGSNVYKKGPTADSTTCSTGAAGTLAKVLTANDCTRVLRVTYTKDNIAVTVGVAVFDTEAQALKVKSQSDSKSIVKALTGKGVKAFCNGAICRSTTNSYGRYAYFTITGFTADKDVTTKDTAVFTTGDDLAESAFQQIRRRGEAQASAAANG
ncbi:hypothetical protein JCM4814A_21250 [Streptomyces phaeofaciens JCM 4814]|uniref:Uncharacterized protein n=1 Tax=Streptomyces phaeofaciens TaxID=68254 RepID=A0A918M1C2_9ACTN|nr:hypothetical protein [Streptomyces phaeofaciens]GGT94970.1 hypothetical protein GCM10010226_85900 [Streptomyces phaeofaciens]